jgi:hypothetical protein
MRKERRQMGESTKNAADVKKTRCHDLSRMAGVDDQGLSMGKEEAEHAYPRCPGSDIVLWLWHANWR